MYPCLDTIKGVVTNTSSFMKHILLVDSYPVIRLAIRAVLDDLCKEIIIHEAASFGEALSEMESCEQDLVVLEVDIPEGEGLQMIRSIRLVQKSVPILIFSASAERVYGIHYLRYGANGFLSKKSSIGELRAAILSVIETGRYVSPRIGTELLNQLDKYNYSIENPLLELSPREITIMDLLMKGLWVKEIASILHVTASTISTYKERLFEKLQVSSIIEMFQKVKHYQDMD